ncbi:MAG: helix-turn-helix transcriptional regulator [Candidatus Thiodiazotropha sp.]
MRSKTRLVEAVVSLHWEGGFPDVDGLIWPFLPLSLWCYVRALVGRPVTRIGPHLMRALAVAVCLMPLILLDAETWRWIESVDSGANPLPPEGRGRDVIIVVVATLAFWLAWMALLIGYGVSMMRQLGRYGSLLQNHYADPAPWDRHRIRSLLILTFVAIGVVLFDQVLSVLGWQGMSDWLDALFRFGLLVGYGVLGLLEPQPQANFVESLPAPSDTQSTDVPESPSYARSALDADDCARLMAKVDGRMSELGLWRQHDLNLTALAEQVAVRPDYLSQAINTHVGCNFYDYVNRKRIEEAQRLLSETDESILSICHTVGFSAKSTFNAAFKRIVGQTPSQFRRERAD